MPPKSKRAIEKEDRLPSTSKELKLTNTRLATGKGNSPVQENLMAESTEDAPAVPSSTVKFKAEVLKKCVEKGIQDPKTKLSNEALIVLDEGLRCLVVEMLSRSANQALGEQLTVVDVSHVEKVLPQLMLDI